MIIYNMIRPRCIFPKSLFNTDDICVVSHLPAKGLRHSGCVVPQNHDRSVSECLKKIFIDDRQYCFQISVHDHWMYEY